VTTQYEMTRRLAPIMLGMNVPTRRPRVADLLVIIFYRWKIAHSDYVFYHIEPIKNLILHSTNFLFIDVAEISATLSFR
jgi:hypothetical protein